jgi:hypothetical protein
VRDTINHEITHKDSRSGNQYGVSNDHVDSRKFLSKSGMNRPPITSLIKRVEKDNEQDPNVEYTEQSAGVAALRNLSLYPSSCSLVPVLSLV